MAITVQSQRNMSGIAHRAYGALSAADVDVDFGATIVLTLGFVPSYVKVVNATDKIIHEWHFGMNRGDYMEEVATGDKTLETDDLLDVNPTTGVVTITVAANPVITDNDLTVWEAVG